MDTVPRTRRRDFLLGTAAAGLALAQGEAALSDEPKAAKTTEPKSDDVPLWLCVDRTLPPERLEQGFALAVRENRENDVLGTYRNSKAIEKPAPLGTPRAAMDYAKKWAQNRVLRVLFLEGDPKVHDRVMHFAKVWEDHVNIKFERVKAAPAEVRVAFQRSLGSWSYLGTDNLGIPPGLPTMNFGWLDRNSDDKTYSSVVLHEFGHLLGLVHEHQSPSSGMRWNRQRVIDDCWRSQGWDAEQVQRQIFDRYPASQTQYTKLDLTSIMMYPFSKEWNLDEVGTPWNTQLSAMDIDFMRRQYPKA